MNQASRVRDAPLGDATTHPRTRAQFTHMYINGHIYIARYKRTKIFVVYIDSGDTGLYYSTIPFRVPLPRV